MGLGETKLVEATEARCRNCPDEKWVCAEGQTAIRLEKGAREMEAEQDRGARRVWNIHDIACGLVPADIEVAL